MSAPAGAVETAPAVATDSPMARYREAYDAMSAGNWLEARRILLGLWKRSQTYDVAASLGQVEYQLLNFVAAARYMSFAIENVAPKESYANLERYRAALEEIRAWVGTIPITTNAAGAEVRVDGEFVGRAPLKEPVFVAPGTHVIEVSNGSDGVLKRKLVIAAGERLPLTFRFPSSTKTTIAEVNATTAETQTALVARPMRDRAPTADKYWVPVYVGASVAAAGALVATGFGLAANAAEDDANELRARVGASGCATGRAAAADCEAASDAVTRQRRLATVSTLGLGIAGAAVAATIGYVVLVPSAEANRAKTSGGAALALEAGVSRLAVSGTF